jgi:SOS-response transcriptional repressor LexA
MAKKLTENQQKILNYIHSYNLQHAMTPTLKEMAAEIGISDSKSASIIINALVKKGYLIKKPNQSRSTFLTAKALDLLTQKPKILSEGQSDIKYHQNTLLNTDATNTIRNQINNLDPHRHTTLTSDGTINNNINKLPINEVFFNFNRTIFNHYQQRKERK